MPFPRLANIRVGGRTDTASSIRRTTVVRQPEATTEPLPAELQANPDFRNMLSALNDVEAEFLIVDAYRPLIHRANRSTPVIELSMSPGNV